MTLRIAPLRWLITLAGVQCLAGIVWILGPLVSVFDPAPARIAVIFALLLLWAATNLALDLRSTRRDGALIQGAAGTDASALGTKLAEALALMRKAKGRHFHLYDQPWYAIIGPPGAGKTTALLNAGLTFPLASTIGPGAVAGVGGTRLCDWWFTDNAVLIDTAGRYTTQDSDQSADRAGWEAFLALLRRTRPRQPLNGVIVAIAINDIAASATQNTSHATAVRARIDELEQRLGIRIPVYALFTKADLLTGFTEFFDDLDRPGREQIWGTTLPLNHPPGLAPLAPLLDRLNRRVFTRLDQEQNPARRALIANFPAQFASILHAIDTFTTQAFGPGENGQPMLRGLYLASGTQEGTPIDRLLGSLSRTFGLNQRRPTPARPARPDAARAYFLAQLLQDVVFHEAPLVGFRPGANTRRRVARAMAFAACLLLAAGGATWVWTGAADARAAITTAETAIAAQQAFAATLPLDPVADGDVGALVPWLDAALPAPATPGADPLGFAQEEKLAAAARAQYRHALEFALLPRLVWRAESQMRGLLGQAGPLYDATRVYLMLGGAGPLDRPLIQDWFTRDFDADYPGDAQAPLRDSLTRHLSALLAEPLPPIPLDGPLVGRARETIGRVPLAARAWSRLKPLAATLAPAPWKPSEALGAAGAHMFIRLSGRPLDEGIPGLYTPAGYRNAIRPALPRAAEQAAAEGWVLGATADTSNPSSLETGILALYAAEYMAVWDAMLQDLDPAPLRSLTQAAQDLYILASTNSPLRAVLVSAATNLAPATAENTPALNPIDQHFQPLRTLAGVGATTLTQVIRPLGDLQQQLAKQAASTTRQPTPAIGEDPAAALKAEAIRQPQPVARWLAALATTGAALRDGGPRGALIGAWNATGGPGPLCAATIANRYPFVPTATSDAPLDDVTRLLGPGGALDAFFNGPLKPYVDTTSRPWKLQPADGISAPLTPADLAQFARAATLRDALFQGGSPQPFVRFDLTPGPLDATPTATLELGTTTLTATRDGPPRPTSLTWPGRPRATNARLTLDGTPPFIAETTGPWAAFRLIALAKPTQSGPRTTLTFTGADRTARFDLRATPNPFGHPDFAAFRCPTVQ